MPTQHELAKLGSEPRSVCAQGTGAAHESQVSAVAVLDQNMSRGDPWLPKESKEEEQVLPKKGEEEDWFLGSKAVAMNMSVETHVFSTGML